MKKFVLIIAALLLTAVILGCGEKSVNKVTKKVLNNGLTVLVKEDHKSPVVSIVTWVKAGYFNEPDSLSGISHLLEHMFFKGTGRRGVGELAKETKDAGGYLNAGTIYDYTCYYTVLPSKSFAKGLDIQSDALINCAIDPDELAKESQVVIQEIKRKLDNPNSFSYEKLLELAFDKHRIRRWRMGYEDQVAGWSREEIYNYYQTRYRPENVILSIVGDISSASALKLVEKYYADFPKGDFKTEFSPAEDRQQGLRYRQMTADINRNIVYAGFHVPGILDADYYPLVVLDFIMSGGRASRLYQEIKEKQSLAESVSSFYGTFQDFGYFVVSAEQNEGDPRELLKAIFRQIERLKIDKISSSELQRILNQLESSYLHSLEEVNGQAQNYAQYEAYGDYRLADTYLDKLRAVTADDVRRVAQKYFGLTNAAVMEYLPADRSYMELSPEKFEELVELDLNEFRTAYKQVEATETAVIDLPSVGGASLPDKPVQKKVLDNGTTIICRENHALPLVAAALYFYGGSSAENEAESGITQLLARTSLKGTASMSASEIVSVIEGMGSNISYVADRDYFGFSYNSMAKNFEEGFSILADIVLNPAFPSEEIEKEKKDLIAAINRQMDSMGGYPIELCHQALFENHPYGLPSLGEASVIEKLTADDLKSRHEQSANAHNMVISFVGDITIDQAIGLTGKYFDKIAEGSKVDMPKPGFDITSIHSKIESRDKAQTSQAVGFATCGYASPDYEILKVFQNIMTGMSGRLWSEVRERRSLAYSVYGYQDAGALTGVFITFMATSPPNAVKARQLVIDLLTGFEDQPPGDEELQRAKNYTSGTFSIYLQPNATQADLYARWELLGKGYQAVDKYPDMIEQIRAEDVLRVARKYFADKYYALGMIEGQGASVEERE